MTSLRNLHQQAVVCTLRVAGYDVYDFENPPPRDPRPMRRAPVPGPADSVIMQRLGRKAAGRELDGRTWDELSTAPSPNRSEVTG